MAHHHNVEDQGEKDLLEEVLGVKTVEITRYEADYGHQVLNIWSMIANT